MIKVACSNMNFFGKDLLQPLGWKAIDFAEAAAAAGYDGLEWHPIRLPWVNRGLFSPTMLDSILSLHQGFREELSLREVWQHRNRLTALATYTMLPHGTVSCRNIIQIQESLKSRIVPIVVYPNLCGEMIRHFLEKSHLVFQPTAKLMSNWNTQTIAGLVAEITRRSIRVCWDTHHIHSFQPDEWRLAIPWQELFNGLADLTDEIHVAVGRIDKPIAHVDTMAELHDFVGAGPPSTTRAMLQQFAKIGWKGHVTVELPLQATAQLYKQGRFTLSRWISSHMRIVETIREIFR